MGTPAAFVGSLNTEPCCPRTRFWRWCPCGLPCHFGQNPTTHGWTILAQYFDTRLLARASWTSAPSHRSVLSRRCKRPSPEEDRGVYGSPPRPDCRKLPPASPAWWAGLPCTPADGGGELSDRLTAAWITGGDSTHIDVSLTRPSRADPAERTRRVHVASPLRTLSSVARGPATTRTTAPGTRRATAPETPGGRRGRSEARFVRPGAAT